MCHNPTLATNQYTRPSVLLHPTLPLHPCPRQPPLLATHPPVTRTLTHGKQNTTHSSYVLTPKSDNQLACNITTVYTISLPTYLPSNTHSHPQPLTQPSTTHTLNNSHPQLNYILNHTLTLLTIHPQPLAHTPKRLLEPPTTHSHLFTHFLRGYRRAQAHTRERKQV